MDKLDKLALLIWKNFVLQKRRPIGCIIEMVLPILFALLLMYFRSQEEVESIDSISFWEPFKVDHLPDYEASVVPKNGTWVVGYAPDTAFVRGLMEDCEKIFGQRGSEVEESCNFDRDQLVQDLQTLIDRIKNPVSSTPPTKLELHVAGIEAAKVGMTVPNYLLNNTEDLMDAFGNYFQNLQVCISRVVSKSRRGEAKRAAAVEVEEGGITITDQLHMLIYNLSKLPSATRIQAQPFKDARAFEKATEKQSFSDKLLAGVIFNGDLKVPSKEVKITYRFHDDPENPEDRRGGGGENRRKNEWKTDLLFPFQQNVGPRAEDSIHGGDPQYYKKGFLALMHCVDLRLAEKLSGDTFNATRDYLSIQRYPYPKYTRDGFIVIIQFAFSTGIILSFFYTAAIIVKSVVVEKEARMKEYMMMMGLPGWIHWLGWYLKYMIFLTISCFLMCVIYKIPVTESTGPILPYSDISLIFIFLVTYASSTINFAFLVSVLFDKANVAAAVGGILYFFSYFPTFYMMPRMEFISKTELVAWSLFSNVAMFNGCFLIGSYERKGTGVQWYHMHVPPTVDSQLSFLEVLLLLIFDSVMYMSLALYIEAVRPGAIGTAYPWYFPFMKSYWTQGSVARRISNEDNDLDNKAEERSEFYEEEPANSKCVLEVKNLRKVYVTNGKVKKAVSGLNMCMYENEITVLLGHNGAGKTTTMAMLTGFTPPTSGDAIINGYSIRADMKNIRRSMGLCPQFNILFDRLTVDEHIFFFSRLKGLTRKEANNESKRMVRRLRLEDKSKTFAKKLSGGMKRKLSVGIALAASSKYVILDEPTSGMDPAARHAIWELLEEYRSKCSMLLSTHFMDEADYLGDRIAIMADGKLRCSGSPLFLKNKFGVGYHIVLTKNEDSDVKQLHDLFRGHVEEAGLERMSGAEVSFVLPFDSSSKFPALFTELDSRAGEFGISGYGATITTMEEVFLRVTENSEVEGSHSKSKKWPLFHRRKNSPVEPVVPVETIPKDANTNEDGNIEMTNLMGQKLPDSVLTKTIIYNTGMVLWRQQFISLFLKHVIHSMRNYKIAIAQILVPVVFTILAILIFLYDVGDRIVVPREFELDDYGYSNVLYEVNANFKDTKDFAAAYAKQYDGSLHTAEEVTPRTLLNSITDRDGSEFSEFGQKHPIAATFSKNESNVEATALFNAQGFHTSATSMQYLDQAYIRYRSKSNDFRLRVTNHPLKKAFNDSVAEETENIGGGDLSFILMLGFSFLSASFVVMYVKERASKAALLQRLTGVSPVLFWLSGFLWDSINFWIPCLITIIMLAVWVDEYSERVGIIFLVFFMYIWASLPSTYCLSFFFNVPSSALLVLTVYNTISGVTGVVVIVILQFLQYETKYWRMFFCVVSPVSGLGRCLVDISENYRNNKIMKECLKFDVGKEFCESLDIKYQENYLAMEEPGIGLNLLYMFLTGCVYWIFLILIDYDIFSFCFHKLFLAKVRQGENMNEDEDVVTERKRINALTDLNTNTTYGLVVKELTKSYRVKLKGSLLAVDRLSFGVPASECFGLLGINGAGKTTTFKMLTGDHYPTSGNAYLHGYNLENNRRHMQQRFGYCPQFDALIEQMTGEETLYMYARLRGVPEEQLSYCVKSLGEILHFDDFFKQPCGTYSGGNKRKLSTAIALVGGPPVVLLDEPSTGMDPGARRMLWNAIADVRRSGRSIIMSSHSMEECEALCTRLAIMVNGTFRCIGNPQHLKSRFGHCFNLELSTIGLEVDIQQLMAELSYRCPGFEFKGGFHNTLSFDIPMKDANGEPRGLAKAFEIMESLKSDLNLGNYTLTQTSLEQVFLRLAKEQVSTP